MANTRQVKSRISTARNISKITKAMEMVAASKMRRAQEQAVAAKPYARVLLQSLNKAAQGIAIDLHPLLSQHAEGKRVALVVATDKGLCGSLNARLIKSVLEWSRQHPKNSVVVAVGKKAVLYCRAAGLEIHAQFTQLPEKIRVVDVAPIVELLISGFLNKSFQSVELIYTDFINTLRQEVRAERLLPIHSLTATGGDLHSSQMTEVNQVAPADAQYLFEPSPKEIFDTLLPFYIENTLYHAFLEAKASEHSARMVAMKNASENAADLVTELQLIFNKTRQQSITSELLDITTAQLALT